MEVTCKVKKILQERQTGKTITRLQVVQWNAYAPVLEKREYWSDKSGKTITGKLKGLNADDFKVVATSGVEVSSLLK